MSSYRATAMPAGRQAGASSIEVQSRVARSLTCSRVNHRAITEYGCKYGRGPRGNFEARSSAPKFLRKRFRGSATKSVRTYGWPHRARGRSICGCCREIPAPKSKQSQSQDNDTASTTVNILEPDDLHRATEFYDAASSVMITLRAGDYCRVLLVPTQSARQFRSPSLPPNRTESRSFD